MSSVNQTSAVLKHVRPFIIKSANSKRDYIHYGWCVIDIPKERVSDKNQNVG